MAQRIVREVRAYVVRGGGADYHDQQGEALDRRPHRDADVALSRVPREPAEVRDQRARHTGRGGRGRRRHRGLRDHDRGRARRVDRREAPGPVRRGRPGHRRSRRSGTRCTRSTLFYGRKGLVLNVHQRRRPGAVRPAGPAARQEPVYALLGGAVRDELVFYATGARPDLAAADGLHRRQDAAATRARARARRACKPTWTGSRRCARRVGDDFWLAVGLLDVARPRLRHPARARLRTTSA